MLQLMVVLDLKIHYNNTMNQEWNVISQKKLVDSPWYKLNIETVRLPSGSRQAKSSMMITCERV